MLKRLFFTILLLGLLSSPAYAHLRPGPEPTPGAGTVPGTIPPAPAYVLYFPLVANNP